MKNLLEKNKFAHTTNLIPATGQNFNMSFAAIAISFLLGVSIIVLSVSSDYIILLAFVFGLPLSLFILTVLPVAFLKIKDLAAQLRYCHFLWLLIFMSGLVFRVRDVETLQKGTVDAWALYRIVLVGLVGFILLGRLILQKTYWVRSLFQGLIGLLTCYGLWATASTLWSVNQSWTLYKSIEYLTDLILIAAIVVSIRNVREFKTLFDWMWVLLMLISLSVWIGLFLWPDQAINRGVGLVGFQVSGVWPHVAQNSLGDYGAILGLIGLSRFFTKEESRNYKIYIALIIFAVGTMFIAYSRTPMAGFFLGGIIVLLLTKKLRPPAAIILICFVAIIILSPLSDYIWEYLRRGESEKNITNLTGRTPLWALAIDAFWDKPFVGYGAFAGSRFYLAQISTTFDNYITSSLDNEWLEILSGVGLVGLFIIVLVLLLLWIWIVRLYKFIERDSTAHNLMVEAIPVLVFIIFRSFFVTNFFIWHPPLIFFLILGYIEFLRRNYKGQNHYEDTYSSQPLPAVRR